MQMSYSSKRDSSSGSEGSTGMILDSSTVRQVRSEDGNETPSELEKEYRLTSLLRCAFLEVQYECLPVDNFYVSSDMNRRQRIITRDHDALLRVSVTIVRQECRMTHAMRGISKHLERLHSIGFQRAVENQEAGEREATFHLRTLHMVYLAMHPGERSTWSVTRQAEPCPCRCCRNLSKPKPAHGYHDA